MPLLRLLAAISLGLLLSACSTLDSWFGGGGGDDEANEPAPLVDFVPEVRFKRLWSTGVGNGQGKGFYRLQPVIDGNRIYVASNNGHVQVLESDSGDRVWRIDLDD